MDWNRFIFSGFVLRRSGGGGAVSCRGRGLLSGTPQMEMGSGCLASSALRSASARSSDGGSAAATYESSLKEAERSSAVASMSEDMRLRLAPLEDGAAAGAGDGVVVGDMVAKTPAAAGDWEGGGGGIGKVTSRPLRKWGKGRRF